MNIGKRGLAALDVLSRRSLLQGLAASFTAAVAPIVATKKAAIKIIPMGPTRALPPFAFDEYRWWMSNPTAPSQFELLVHRTAIQAAQVAAQHRTYCWKTASVPEGDRNLTAAQASTPHERLQDKPTGA